MVSICPSKALAKVEVISLQIKKVATDDPRRLIHSLKVGLALTLVSLFYYFEPLYSSFGVTAMWAVMTVVVVFEFSVGATLGKGLNRGLGTLLAGGLGLGAHHLASVSGKTCEPILIGLFVFLQAVASTFVRFFPTVKARYDYGMLIFILTFCLVSISGLRTDEILELAQKRLSAIVIGASTCVIVSIFVYPVWAGEDLHKLVATNIDKIGSFLEGLLILPTTRIPTGLKLKISLQSSFIRFKFQVLHFGFADECLRTIEEFENGRTSSLVGLNSVLDSKSTVETLAPQEIQTIISIMSSKSGKALKELAWSLETMTRNSSHPNNSHSSNLKIVSKNLNSMLKSGFWEEHTNLLQVIPVAAAASLLNDTITSVENIAHAIDELSSLANFKFHDSSGVDEKTILEKKKNISLDSVVIDGGGQVN